MKTTSCPYRLATWTSLLLGAIGVFTPTAAAQNSPSAGLVLDTTSSYWRVYYAMRAPVVRTGTELKTLPTLTGNTPAPPQDWTQADFDDGQWTRIVGKPLVTKLGYNPPRELADAGITELEGSSPALALICLRGKFGVTNAATVADLKLSIRFHGGVIVYVNGKEVGRANMPKEASGLDALADDYPKEAFIRPDGSPEITSSNHGTYDKATIYAMAARVRSADIVIPSTCLRKGGNVLAIEIHRAAYSSAVTDWVLRRKLSYQLYGMLWATCGLNAATLQGASPAGLTANVSRPKGLQIWNSQPMQPDFDVDWGDPFEPVRPIKLVGSHNGVCSGKIVVGGDQPIRRLKATITDLAAVKGGGTIPASSIQIRYAQPSGEEPILQDHFPVRADLFDGLGEAAPVVVEVRTKDKGIWPFGAVCPVWVTLAVPEGVPAGLYTGTLNITADGFKNNVPVEVTVCAWPTPNPSDFRTVLDIMQSPETVAMQYDVPIYSDKHFKLLAKSLERGGYIGSWTLHVPLICQSNLGNAQTMVRWIGQGDGSYKFDYTPLEKYLDLAEKHMGKPRALDLVVWDLFIGGPPAEMKEAQAHNTNLTDLQPRDIPVSLLDEATGKVTMGTVGRYDARGKGNWKALIGGLMERLAKRGLDKSLHLGHAYDISCTDDIAAFWSELLPGAHWIRYGHYDYRTFGKTPAGVSDFIVHEWAPDWSEKPQYGWKNPVIDLPWMRLQSDRNVAGGYWKSDPYVTMPTEMFRVWSEICVQGPYRGFGRMGLDFWPELENERGQKNMMGIQGRYPNSSWRQSDEMILCIVPPGPEGALSSSKLEMIREGLQETEARIFLENVLLTRKARLSAALATSVQAILDERAGALRMALERQPIAGFDPKPVAYLDGYSYNGLYAMVHGAIFHQWFMESDWQKRSEDLFTVAGEVAAAVK